MRPEDNFRGDIGRKKVSLIPRLPQHLEVQEMWGNQQRKLGRSIQR